MRLTRRPSRTTRSTRTNTVITAVTTIIALATRRRLAPQAISGTG